MGAFLQLPLDPGDLLLGGPATLDGLRDQVFHVALKLWRELDPPEVPAHHYQRSRQVVAQSPVLLRLHAARDRLQLLPGLLGFPGVFGDLGDGGEQRRALVRQGVFASDRVGERQHVPQAGRIALHQFFQFQSLLNRQRRPGERLLQAALSALDAPGEFDLTLAREQRHGSHLAQVHADGVVGLLGGVGARLKLRQFLGFLGLAVELELGFLEDLHARAVEIGEKLIQYGAAHDVVGQYFVDLVVKEKALLLPGVDETLQTAVFLFDRHTTPVQNARRKTTYNILQHRAHWLLPLPSLESSSLRRNASARFPDRSASLTRVRREVFAESSRSSSSFLKQACASASV